MTPRSPVPDEVAVELERVVRRWQQLPLDHALRHVPTVRALVQELADEGALAAGRACTEVPDLGPAALPDQLAVVTYDACRLGPGTGPDLAARLAEVRRVLG